MIVLDTNVVSGLMLTVRDSATASWMAGQVTSSLYLTAVTEAELRFGLAIMPAGRRRDGLSSALERMLRGGFANRVLPFDREAASTYAEIAAARRRIGRPISQLDCQIAAIARSRGMAVATRNLRDFAEMGIDLIDPWDSA